MDDFLWSKRIFFYKYDFFFFLIFFATYKNEELDLLSKKQRNNAKERKFIMKMIKKD